MSGLPSGQYSIVSAVEQFIIGVDGTPPLVRVVTEPRVFAIQRSEDGKYAMRVPTYPGFLCPDDRYIAPGCDEPYGWIISQVDGRGGGYTIETWGLMPHQFWTLKSPEEPITLEYLETSTPLPAQKWYFVPYDGLE